MVSLKLLTVKQLRTTSTKTLKSFLTCLQVSIKIRIVIETIYGIRSEIRYWPCKPVRDPQYCRWLKRLPCAACGRSWGVDPAHTGPHGLSQKASDRNCIPLCRRCHDAFDAAPQEFAEQHQLEIPALIERLNQDYDEIVKRKVA